ncbi:eukaryotic translation initiation factor EIF4E family protein [archaeon]|nr:eukaryotic translation initiation factor EIF4E family protein [archaeon]
MIKNNEDYQSFTKEDVPQKEEDTIEEEKVLLNRTWTFWETYEPKAKGNIDWSLLTKKIFSFKDIISFWQFWNSYPGSNFSEVFFNGEQLK